MDIYNFMIMEKTKLTERIIAEEKFIGNSEKGYVTFRTQKNKVSVYYNDEDKKNLYIRKTEYKKYVKEIKQAYCLKQLRFDRMYLTAIEAFLKKYNPNIRRADIVFQNSEDLARLLFPQINTLSKKLANWFEESYESDPPFPEKRVVKTIHGERVRSKSECIIADAMFNGGIPYRYEYKMEIEGVTVHPDFVIMHPKTGQIFIWEHLGKTDDSQYLLENIKKLELYAKAGYIAGKNLIITTESTEHPLDSDTVNLIIKRNFYNV